MTPVLPRLNQVLSGAAVLLIGLAIWPWVAPIAAPGRPAPADADKATPAIAALPPLATFSGVFERPLFSPSRRPPAAAKAPVASSGVERYRLLGLVTAGETRRALLIDGNRRIE